VTVPAAPRKVILAISGVLYRRRILQLKTRAANFV
jgi:hypothetical protein